MYEQSATLVANEVTVARARLWMPRELSLIAAPPPSPSPPLQTLAVTGLRLIHWPVSRSSSGLGALGAGRRLIDTSSGLVSETKSVSDFFRRAL